ncbi:Myosin head (motor domain) [Ceratobasidium sp. AG-Ba]|nr:Myosin head (motor domain) [Ceratobasidium sp. AG-Ba]
MHSNTEAARAAALQAEFNEKKWVWVPDENEGYLAGWVVNETTNERGVEEGEIVMAAGGEIRIMPLYALSKMNPPKFDRVDDIADLTFLNEASVVHNLRLRYGSGAIYTYSGLFLVAINPYTNLPLYTDAIVQQYRAKRRDENAPHIFAIAERAWVSMGEERENQSILITGESGAGKTENTKKVIQYLAAIANEASASGASGAVPETGVPRSSSFKGKHTPSGSIGKFCASCKTPSLIKHMHTGSTSVGATTISTSKLGLLERQILQANPILEAFGNAQTARNNNSSRFGKFVRIAFAGDGSIAGATIDWYLLEKSRIVARSEIERSFHVFYMLLEGGGGLRNTLLLDGGVGDYEYLNKSRREVDGIDDREEWRSLKAALDIVGFSPDEQIDLFRVVGAILHIGNIVITADRGDQAQIKSPVALEKACHLLGISPQEFTKAILRPKVLAGREWVTQARTKQQAIDELGALCKTMYEKTFGGLVDRINRALERPTSKATFIGVLDIAGFEIFETNGFEQLCINYTNERLQQFFNRHMFILEQEEYAREGIEWEFVDFGMDLQPTIELIESTSASGQGGGTVSGHGPGGGGAGVGWIGILSCLDEECIMPKATDMTFTNKLHAIWSPPGMDEEQPAHMGQTKYAPARFAQGFIVQHYAGRVEYRTEGWLEKNKDPLNDNIGRVMAGASERYIADLFVDFVDAGTGAVGGAGAVFGGVKKRVKKGAFRTVAQKHKEQLATLMSTLQATQPHFVRCIVPNGLKRPGRIDVPLVLDQLRCNGVLEGIRIARLGYPNRLPFAEFRQRYELLTPGVIPRGYMDGRKACLRMVDALELDESAYRIGTSKVFFKAGVLAELEEQRDGLLFDVFSRFQAAARRFTARRQMKKILNRAVAIRTIQRNARVYVELREWPWWQLYTKVRPLLAATRNDEELRIKEMELAQARELAERDKAEKAALEGLKMRLEAEKIKVEEQLEAERQLGLDKEELLDRAQARVAELEEEYNTAQADLEELDSQLERALAAVKAGEEKYTKLKEAFDEAAEHLARLEDGEKEWDEERKEKEELCIELEAHRDRLEQELIELKGALAEREEDIALLKERMESTISELENKLGAEVRTRDVGKAKLDVLEKEARQAKDQITELSRTATDYENMLQRKETDIARITSELAAIRKERDAAVKQCAELEGDIDTLAKELDAQRDDAERDSQARTKLQKELDELRAVMQAKVSEDTQRAEAEKSREQELGVLRMQASELSAELASVRRQATEAQNKLRVDLEAAQRDNAAMNRTLSELKSSSSASQSKLIELEAALAAAEKAKRAVEAELQTMRARQIEGDNRLEEVTKAKEALEKQVAAAQAKHQDFEDAVLQIEREKQSWVRQLDGIRKELETEASKKSKLEKSAASHAREVAKLKDTIVKFERDLKKAHDDIRNKEWEISQLKSKQDKTIVEHVHVLEAAKKVTDGQLADAQVELQRLTTYVRSLEKAKTRLSAEAEDYARETERERQEQRAKDKALKAANEKLARAEAEIEGERHAREGAETQTRRLQDEMQILQSQLSDAARQMSTLNRSKDALEAELANIADDGETKNAMANLRRQYEARIHQLQTQIEDSDTARSIGERIKQRVERQLMEIRRLVATSAPKDDAFRARLLNALTAVDQEMEQEIAARVRANSMGSKDRDVKNYGNLTPSKRASKSNGAGPRLSETPRPPDSQQDEALRQQIHILELQMIASDRVRQHLESSLRELSQDLDKSDGSKQSLQVYRARLAKENERLSELLADEAEARQAAENAQLGGVKSVWSKFQHLMSEERESYTKLEESRRALLAQQRAAQIEVEDNRRQVTELNQSKKQLMVEVANLKERLEMEVMAKNEESTAKRRLQAELQELEITSSSSSAIHTELKQAVETYKAQVSQYMERIETAELAKAQSQRAESLARRALAENEKILAESNNERLEVEAALERAEKHIVDLEAKLEDENREVTNMELLQQRLAEAMEEERDQYAKDLQERDFAIDQTRKKYQTELAQLSEELQYQRDAMSRLREENRKARSELDELHLRYDDEVYSGGNWKKEKERFETKINDLTAAYESATNAQTEQQTQIVGLLSQVRELRAVLDEAEADRAALQKARRALEGRLNDIAQEHMEASKFSSDRVVQELHLKNQELRGALDEQTDRVQLATDRLKKAESYANDSQVELKKVREENASLDRLNATLEKQVKELNLRVVDLETQSYASSPRAPGTRRMDSRIEELTSKIKSDTLRESERSRARYEEEMRAYDEKLQQMRQALDDMQTSESNLQLAKRRAERESADYKQRALALERELERLRGRAERPPSRVERPPSRIERPPSRVERPPSALVDRSSPTRIPSPVRKEVKFET